jgi:two-component system, NarL family, sensor histidine kinase UhpB
LPQALSPGILRVSRQNRHHEEERVLSTPAPQQGDEAAATGAGQGATRAPARLVGRFLRVPLYYKILLANAAIVVGGVALATALGAEFVRAQPGRSTLELVAVVAVGGVVVSVLVNALILRLALRPLGGLERTADRVAAGELDARAPLSPLADARMARLTHTFNAMLDAQAASRERLRRIAAGAVRAAEEERKRIARELHDETAQILAALLIQLKTVRQVEDPARADARLGELRTGLAEALEGVRRFARGLRPPALDELGLGPALTAHGRMVAEVSGLDVRVQVEGVPGALPPEAELAVYRIAQEALSNVVRHARARRVELALERTGDALRLRVADDGRGFDPDDAAGGRERLGLFGMRERASYAGGTLQVDSRPGRGTRITAVVPVAGGTVPDLEVGDG